MNKKDIASFRRQLKVENDLLSIKEIFNVYIMKESSEIYHQVQTPFEMLEKEQQELFMNNFKKVLAGQLDQKLFELKFAQDVENSSQLILHQALKSNSPEEWNARMLEMVDKMLAVKQYEQDIVITFIRGEYLKTVKPISENTEESDRDKVYSHSFLMCTINTTQDPKKELLFDYVEKEFKYNFVVDPIIDLNAPLSGFLFPCFSEGAADVNHILYSTGKSKELDFAFVEDVLNAEEAMTAEEDKVVFEEVVKDIAGDQLSTETLANVYEEIQRVIEETDPEETPKLDYRDVQTVLQSSGVEDVDTESVEAAFKKITDDERFELKANNVMPKYNSKSIKIQTKVADLKLSPQELRYVRQMRVDGKLCLVIELEENTVIEGFEMLTEE
ncbi:DUF4317 domain-containing protein [Oceanobacillus sp. CAU 1775]